MRVNLTIALNPEERKVSCIYLKEMVKVLPMARPNSTRSTPAPIRTPAHQKGQATFQEMLWWMQIYT